jgi:hypothetical protein
MPNTRRKSVATPLALAGLGAAVLALTVGGVSAMLSAQTQNPRVEAVTAGTLSLSLSDNGAGFSQDVSNLAPGDVVNRYVNLTNNGSLDGQNLSLAVTGVGSQALITDGLSTKALTLSITSCSVSWDAMTGVCAGTSSSLLTGATLSTLANGKALENSAFKSGQVRHLQFALTLPDQSETTTNGVTPAESIQGQKVSLSYTLGVTQRAATTNNQ